MMPLCELVVDLVLDAPVSVFDGNRLTGVSIAGEAISCGRRLRYTGLVLPGQGGEHRCPAGHISFVQILKPANRRSNS